MSASARPTHDAATEPYQPVFTGKVLEELQSLLGRYPTKQGALLPALWLVQQQRGWISDRDMTEVAAVLGLTPAYVKGVVTFYTMYHQHPVGQNFVQVCTTSPCNICGAEDVVRALLQATGAKELGATSPDGRWTVIEVECLGACGFATPVLINDDFIETDGGVHNVRVFNNRGVIKPQHGILPTEHGEREVVTIHSTMGLTKASEWITGSTVEVKKDGAASTIELVVPAGGVRIIELQ